MVVDILWTWIEANRVDAKTGPKRQIVVTFYPFMSSFLFFSCCLVPSYHFFAKNFFLLVFH